MKNDKNKIIKQIFPYLLILLGAYLLVLHAPLSFCASDEAFYASTTNRFIQGDGVFVHEWFPTQLVSILLVPIQGAFVTINGGNDGVLLFMRYAYIAFSTISASLIYTLLVKRHGKFPACCCGLFALFYAHLNIASMSYYTISYQCFVLSMLIIISAYDGVIKTGVRKPLDIGRRAVVLYIIGGLVFAADVLALPSLAVVYFLLAFVYLFLFVIDRIIQGKMPLWIHRIIYEIFPAAIYTLIGIAALAIPVLIYVLPRSGIMGIINNLGYVLSDEEHITSLVAPFKKFFLSVVDVFNRDVYLSVLLVIIAILVYVVRDLLKKKIKGIKVICGLIFVLDLIMFIYYVSKTLGHTGYLSTAIVLFAAPLFFISEKKDWLMFYLLFIGGLVFSMVYSYSSNGDLYVLSIGHSISAIAGMCFVWDYNFGSKDDSAFLGILFGIILAICVMLTASLRFINIYRDSPVIYLTEEITEGPAKGLKTTIEHKASYDKILSVIRENDGDGQIFFTKLLPWGYLATDKRCGAPTTWRTKFNSERLRLYYTENPDRIPDTIIVVPKETGAYDTCGDVVADPTPNENEMGGYLEEIVSSGNYSIYETDGFIVYKKELK